MASESDRIGLSLEEQFSQPSLTPSVISHAGITDSDHGDNHSKDSDSKAHGESEEDHESGGGCGGGGHDDEGAFDMIRAGGEGTDLLFGDHRRNLITGGKGHDWIFGLDGDDQIVGGQGKDKLFGGDGNDRLIGGDDHDILYGGSGADRMTGGQGNDLLIGGAGNDTLNGGQGRNMLSGGDGQDTFMLCPQGYAIIQDFQMGTDYLKIHGADTAELSLGIRTWRGATIVYNGDTIALLWGIRLPDDMNLSSLFAPHGNDIKISSQV